MLEFTEYSSIQFGETLSVLCDSWQSFVLQSATL